MKPSEFKLENEKISLSVLDVGASLFKLSFDGQQVVRSLENVVDYLENPEGFGATIAPRAGRYSDFQSDLVKMEGFTLHSGLETLQRSKYEVSSQSDQHIEFCHENQNGLKIIVRYTLLAHGVDILFQGFAKNPTPLNITNHSYFHLDDQKDLLHHVLQMDTTSKTKNDQKLLPTGIIPVNKAESFLEGRKLDQQEIDQYYFFDKEKKCVLYSEKSKIEMKIETTYPGVVVYTHCSPIHPEEKFSSVALEVQYPPNALNLGYLETIVASQKPYEHSLRLSFIRR